MHQKDPKAFFRWFLSLTIAFLILLTTLFSVLRVEKEYPIRQAPPVELTFVTLKDKKEPKGKMPTPQKPKPKKKKPEVKKKKIIQKKPTPQKAVAEKIEKVEETETEERLVDTTTTEKESEEQEVKSSSNVPALPQRISGAASLDNSDFSPLFNPKPKYPTIAKRAGIEGFVDIDLIIDPKGKVKEYTIVSTHGHQSFANETKKVIMKWRFPPPRLNGNPITVKYLYRLKFTLH